MTEGHFFPRKVPMFTGERLARNDTLVAKNKVASKQGCFIGHTPYFFPFGGEALSQAVVENKFVALSIQALPQHPVVRTALHLIEHQF